MQQRAHIFSNPSSISITRTTRALVAEEDDQDEPVAVAAVYLIVIDEAVSLTL